MSHSLRKALFVAVFVIAIGVTLHAQSSSPSDPANEGSSTSASPISSDTPPSEESSTANEVETVQSNTDDPFFSLEFRYAQAIHGQTFPTSPTAEYPDVNGVRAATFRMLAGFGFLLRIDELVRLRIGFDFTQDEFVYKAIYQRAFATPIQTGGEVGTVASVWGLVVSAGFSFFVPLTENLDLVLTPGISFYPRAALEKIEGTGDIAQISDYLLKDGRWLYLHTEFGLHYRASRWLGFTLNLRAMHPIWHLWDSDDLSYGEQFVFAPGLFLTVYP